VHSSDVRYVFNTLRFKDYHGPTLTAKSRHAGVYWTNFAKNANPSGPGLTSWAAYNPKDEYLLNIGDAVRLERFNSAGVDVMPPPRTTSAGPALQKRTRNALSWHIALTRQGENHEETTCPTVLAALAAYRSRPPFREPVKVEGGW